MNDHRESPGDEDSSDRHSSHGGHDKHKDGQRSPADEQESTRIEQSMLEEEAEDANEGEREIDEQYNHETAHGADSGGHDGHSGGGMHEGHEQMFRRRFFVSTLLSIPVLLYSETLQAWLGFSVPAFPGSEWIDPVFAVIVFAYGGVPFLRMAVPELGDRAPGMMT